jgi:tetratricopeptide (TPR) repeat protein
MNRREIILNEINENPQNPFNYYLLAVEERSIGSVSASIEILQQLILNFPNYHPSYYTLAELLYQEDRTSEATAIAEQGIVKAKDLHLLKVSRELEQLILLND